MIAFRGGVLLSLVSLSLAACGGGGGGGSAGFPTYAATTADTMLLPLVTAAGELKLVDPANPANPTTVDTDLEPPTHFNENLDAQPVLSGPTFVFSGDYQAATHSVLGAHYRYAWYIKAGLLYRVDLLASSSHTPARFSAVDDACDWSGLALDYANPLNTHVAIRRAGTDTDCYTDDDTAAWVGLGAAIDDAGVTISPDLFVFEWVPAPDGSPQRVLAINFTTSEFTSHAPDMSSTTLLATVDEFAPGPDWSRTDQYFRLRPVGGDYALYHYDGTDDSLTPVYTYYYDSPHFLLADTDHVYFNDGDFVIRMPHGSTEFEVVHDFNSDLENKTWLEASLTASRMVFVMRHNATFLDSLESLPKAGGEQRTVIETGSPALPYVELIATGGPWVYYRLTEPSLAVSDAGRVRETGSGKVLIENALWIGTQGNPDAQVGALDPDKQRRTLLLGAVDDSGVATVRGVDAASGVSGPVLGTIAGASTASSTGYGRYVLLDVLMDRGGSRDFDVYFADIQAADSLEPVADTMFADDAAP